VTNAHALSRFVGSTKIVRGLARNMAPRPPILGGSAAPLASPPPTVTFAHAEYFDGSDPGWHSPVGEDWRGVAASAYWLKAYEPGYLAITVAPAAWAMPYGHLRARARTVSGENRPINAQLLFDYQDDQHYKIAGLRAGGKNWAIKAVADGVESDLATPVSDATLQADRWYQLDLVVARDKVTLYADGVERISWQPGGSNRLTGGRVGFMVKGSLAEFQELEQWDVGQVTKYYAVGGQRVALRRDNALYYVFSDHLGSTSLLTDASGNQVAEQRYYPYGEARWSNGELPTDRQFTGQRREIGLGLYDYGARRYDPALGRFIQADTIVPQPGNPQALNRYSYVLGNPLRYTDPTGHVFIEGTGGGGAIGVIPGAFVSPRTWGGGGSSGGGSAPGPVPIPVPTPPQGTPVPWQIAANQPGASAPWNWGVLFTPDTVVTLYAGVESASDYAVGYVNAAEGYAIYKVLGKDGKEYWVAAGSAAALRKIGLNPGVANSPAAMKVVRATGRGGDVLFFLAGGAASVGPNLVAHAVHGDFWSWETATDLVVDTGGWLVSDLGGAVIGVGVQVALPGTFPFGAIGGEVVGSVFLSSAWDNRIAPGARAWVRYQLPH